MNIVLLLLLVSLTGCASIENKKGAANKSASNDAELLIKGQEELSRSNTMQAIEKYFNPVISHCDVMYKHSPKKVYCSRGMSEATYYMALAVSAKQEAIAVEPTCADALYLKGYASLDLGQVDEAVSYIKSALELSPLNSMYLSELGQLYHIQKKEELALSTYSEAEQNAELFSPESTKNKELSRAKRGVGFSLIELGRLSEAEKKFDECLKIDNTDQHALHEINYIKSLKK